MNDALPGFPHGAFDAEVAALYGGRPYKWVLKVANYFFRKGNTLLANLLTDSVTFNAAA
jgi:hypothetical protein